MAAMSERTRLAVEIVGLLLFAAGVALALSLLDTRVAAGAGLAIIGLYCAVAANVYGSDRSP